MFGSLVYILTIGLSSLSVKVMGQVIGQRWEKFTTERTTIYCDIEPSARIARTFYEEGDGTARRHDKCEPITEVCWRTPQSGSAVEILVRGSKVKPHEAQRFLAFGRQKQVANCFSVYFANSVNHGYL